MCGGTPVWPAFPTPDGRAMSTAQTSRTERWTAARPWVGTAARLVLGVVFLVAGGSKVTDLAASGRAVAAYRILPFEAATVVGAALPMVELLIGLLLVVGLATRVAATVGTALLAVFIGGIASAWARGLSIDCGCFGGGGDLAAGVRPSYGPEITRDLALLALAVFLLVYPRTRFSLDSSIVGSEDNA
jgi:uncharacterized membrane protein YphA (DoxX/SURF4 family)